MHSHKKNGFSLIEMLVALSLLSLTLVMLSKAQFSLLRKMQTTHIASTVRFHQISLAESLKSCQGHIECQRNVFNQWEEKIQSAIPHIKLDIHRTDSDCHIMTDAKTHVHLKFKL